MKLAYILIDAVEYNAIITPLNMVHTILNNKPAIFTRPHPGRMRIGQGLFLPLTKERNT